MKINVKRQFGAILVVVLLVVAHEAGATTFRSYHIGNSLTADMSAAVFPDFAELVGASGTQGQHIRASFTYS